MRREKYNKDIKILIYMLFDGATLNARTRNRK